MAGLEARVIKVENPAGGDSCRTNAPYLGAHGPKFTRESEDDISVSALNRLRNKLGVTLNLKHPGARAVYADLGLRKTLDQRGIPSLLMREDASDELSSKCHQRMDDFISSIAAGS
jgi:hypothetical protein